MKFFIAFLLTAMLAFVCGLFFPWWWLFAITSAIVAGLIYQRPLNAFLAGFLALFIFWIGYALFLDNANDHLLSQKIASIVHVNTLFLLLITGLLGGLIAGMAALTGSLFRQALAATYKRTVVYKEEETTTVVEEQATS